jgi:hypothetical protein
MSIPAWNFPQRGPKGELKGPLKLGVGLDAGAGRRWNGWGWRGHRHAQRVFEGGALIRREGSVWLDLLHYLGPRDEEALADLQWRRRLQPVRLCERGNRDPVGLADPEQSLSPLHHVRHALRLRPRLGPGPRRQGLIGDRYAAEHHQENPEPARKRECTENRRGGGQAPGLWVWSIHWRKLYAAVLAASTHGLVGLADRPILARGSRPLSVPEVMHNEQSASLDSSPFVHIDSPERRARVPHPGAISRHPSQRAPGPSSDHLRS